MKRNTPFSTRLSGSARETELRLRNIFQWKRRRPPVIFLLLVLVIALGCGGLVACRQRQGDVAVKGDEANFDPTADLYAEILDLYYESGWLLQTDRDAWNELQSSDDSPYSELVYAMTCPYWAFDHHEDFLSRIGYGVRDLNGDGISELLLGWIGNEIWNMEEGYVFAIYTLKDQEPVLAFGGGERNRGMIAEDGTLVNEGSSGATEGSCIRYRFPDEPVEGIWHGWNEKTQSICYVYSDDPEELTRLAHPSTYDHWIDAESAMAQTEDWLSKGAVLSCTPFSDYERAALKASGDGAMPDEQRIAFVQEPLSAAPASLLEEAVVGFKTFEHDGMQFQLYQPEEENIYYHLAVTVAGKNYDLGRVGYGNPDLIGNSIVQTTGISAAESIYALIQREDIELTRTTYFAIRDQVPVLLCSIPGIGKQVDVDGDGQAETIANCGLSTWPNEMLYEWQIDENELCCADLRQQLGSDTAIFDDENMCFLAGRNTDSGWHYDRYQYRGAFLKKADRS